MRIRHMKVRLVMAAALAFLLCQCSDKQESKKANAPPAYIIYSPNGEPLNGGPLGKLTCDKALSGWFDRIANGANAISKDVFINDAQAQFTKMDIDKHGYLVSEELDRYREPYRQEPVPSKPEPEEKSAQKGKHKNNSSKPEHHETSPASLIDPVMSADTNLDFRVTQAEFMAQAQENFTKLDSNHDNMLSREEIVAACHTEEKH